MFGMKILVDGHEFHAKLNEQAATRERIEATAHEFRANLAKISSISIELTDGSFLVLGEKQLERAIFVFVATADV